MADIFNIAGEINSTSYEGTAVHANQVKDDLQNKKQSQINEEVGEELELHTNRLNALTGQNYITVQATQSTTAADIPTLINASGEGEQADTLYRVGFWDGSAYVADKYTEYAWNGTAYVILDVKSSIGEVFDISQYNAVGGTLATYADLEAALGVEGENVPSSVRRGGMSITFVHTSGNQYVQYRYMGTETTGTPNPFLDTANWQGVDDKPTAGSKNLVESGGVVDYTQLAAGISCLDGDISTSGQNVQHLGGVSLKGQNLNIIVKIVRNTASFSDNEVFGVIVGSTPKLLSYNSAKGYWYGFVTTSEKSVQLYVRKVSISSSGHITVAVFTDEGCGLIENIGSENEKQLETLVGSSVESANSIAGNYTSISGLELNKKYVLKLTLNSDAIVNVATATNGSISDRVTPFIYTNQYLTAGSHVVEFTYNGGSLLALHDSGLGYSVFSSFVIYKSLSNELDEKFTDVTNDITDINENIVQSVSAESTSTQYPSAKCLYEQFETMPQTKNLLNPNALARGYISDNMGTISDSGTFKVTEFIPVGDIEKLYFYNNISSTHMFYLLAYDEDRVAIQNSYTNDQTSPVTIQSSWKYIRFCFNPTNIQNPFLVSEESTVFVPFIGNRVVVGDETHIRVNKIEEFIDENVKSYVPDRQVSLVLNPNKIISQDDGSVIDFANHPTYCVTDAVPVVAGQSYSITANANFSKLIYAFYSEDNILMDNEQSGSGSTPTAVVSKIVTVPYGATKLRMACILPNSAVLYINKESSYANQYLPFVGKKWVCIGDSLTEYNQRTSLHYFDYVAANTGIEIVNLGISGTGYAKGGSTNNFLTRISSIPLDADVITIFGSFNDLSAGLSVGNIDDDDNTTLCGCINLVLDAIQERVPLVPLGIVSPTPWNSARPNVEGNSNGDNYVAALKDICRYRSIPFEDLYHCSNLHPESADFRILAYSKDGTYANSTEETPGAIEVTSDNIDTINSFLASGSTTVEVGDWVLPNLLGCHPNEEGHKLIAGRFESLLKSII